MLRRKLSIAVVLRWIRCGSRVGRCWPLPGVTEALVLARTQMAEIVGVVEVCTGASAHITEVT